MLPRKPPWTYRARRGRTSARPRPRSRSRLISRPGRGGCVARLRLGVRHFAACSKRGLRASARSTGPAMTPGDHGHMDVLGCRRAPPSSPRMRRQLPPRPTRDGEGAQVPMAELPSRENKHRQWLTAGSWNIIPTRKRWQSASAFSYMHIETGGGKVICNQQVGAGSVGSLY